MKSHGEKNSLEVARKKNLKISGFLLTTASLYLSPNLVIPTINTLLFLVSASQEFWKVQLREKARLLCGYNPVVPGPGTLVWLEQLVLAGTSLLLCGFSIWSFCLGYLGLPHIIAAPGWSDYLIAI